MDAELPMIDPHELLEWLWVNEKVDIRDDDIK